MEKYSVGIIGATGMVGQRFALLLAEHPWFDVKVMAASARSAGKTYKEAVGKRWLLADPMPAKFENMIVMDATADMKTIAGAVDFVFCAVDMPKAEIKAGNMLKATAEGKCEPAAAGDVVNAIALEPAAAGDLCKVMITHTTVPA